jgi:predicted lipoprotein with Yx(FWY)xxD motif
MSYFNKNRPSPFQPALATALLGALFSYACLDESPGITEGNGAAAGQAATAGAGAADEGGGGKKANTAGTASQEGGRPRDDESGGGAAEGGTPGVSGTAPVEGGAPQEATEGGASGAATEDGVRIAPYCTFNTEGPPPVEGAGGEGPAPEVALQVSPFVGSYLVDGTGRTLYTYGADLAGDCETPPESTCLADCLVSWPPFHAPSRLLGPGLDDSAFGEIQLADGSHQTTYMGWPLYYYKTDLTLGQLTGQGKGKIWHVAEATLPSITIMKTGTLKYLADAGGHTLYVSAADQAGTLDADPVSNCSGDCLDTFEAFNAKKLSVVTVLEPLDFEVFVRHGAGGLQLSYKGMPLYRAATDKKSGDMTGTAITGFTAAVP